MPGTFSNAKEIMYARVRVQYFKRVEPRGWRFAPGRRSDSGWIRLGNARRRSRQSGYTAVFAPQGFRFRAVVSFQWRKGRAIEYFASELTSARTSGRHERRAARPLDRHMRDREDAKSRGSFVMMPVTPSRSNAAIRAASSTVQT